MIQKVLLPKLGQTMEEATIAAWHVKEGDAVKKGQVICEITTDKATLEVESLAQGTVRHILAKQGEVVPVNDTIAVVADPGEEIPAETLKRGAPKPKAEAQPAATVASGPAAAPSVSRSASAPSPAVAASGQAVTVVEEPVALEAGFIAPGRKAITPRARALARELGIPILAVDGAGESGRVHESDVRAYHESVKDLRFTPMAREICLERNVDLRVFVGADAERVTQAMAEAAPALRGGVLEPLNAMRRVIATRMAQSTRTAPHFYLTTVVDMTASLEMRTRLKKEKVRFSVNDLLIKACGVALRRFPRVASVYSPAGYVPRDHMNVGFAVAVGDEGLVVPVVRDADRKSLAQIAEETREFINKARSNKLTVDDYSGGVFTVSNLGTFEVDQFTAIINPGESAILAVGKTADTPCVLDGAVVIRQLMKITLSSDHRTIDGVLAARFNGCLKSLLEAPDPLV